MTPIRSRLFHHRNYRYDTAAIQPGVWHTMAVLSAHVVCFEVKPGPYSETNDKNFAPWAPREGDPRAKAYLERLVTSVVPP